MVPETYTPQILKKKAKRLRSEGNGKYVAQMELEQKSLIKAIAHFCSRPFGMRRYYPPNNRIITSRTNLSITMRIHRLPIIDIISLFRSFSARLQK
jgi:hypothetical protein